MSELPPLRGSAKQVKWAETIRANTFGDKDIYGMAVLIQAEKVDDATWWIANKTSKNKLVTIPKDPQPHQLVGGPPPPMNSQLARQQNLVETVGGVTERVQRLLGEPRHNGVDETDEPHEAELFAESVAQNPALAEVAVLGLMARLYTKGANKTVGDMLKHRARLKLEGAREHLIAKIDRDLDGLERILK